MTTAQYDDAVTPLGMLRVGTKLRWSDGKLYHVRGFVDDRVVLRRWSKHSRRWRYQIERRHFISQPFGWSLA